jgi:rhodanese-related sulfurtransferase
VKKAVETGNPIIIDVRNPEELQGGVIPTAHNIPLSALSTALGLSSAEFSQRYGFNKPASGSSLIFSCQKGVRAMSAAETAKGLGYDSICYSGSFNDWSQQ